MSAVMDASRTRRRPPGTIAAHLVALFLIALWAAAGILIAIAVA